MLRKLEKVNKSFNSFKPLLSKVLTKARENSTTKTYSSYFEKWKIWAAQFPEVKALPADEFHIVLYMIHSLQTGKTSQNEQFCHKLLSFNSRDQNPCPTSLPYNVLEGIKRILAYSGTKKSPVTVSQLYEMYNYFGSKTVFQICKQFWSVFYRLWVF